MLKRIKEDGYETEALAVLRWIAYSRRPFLLEEVAEVAAFETTENKQAKDGDYSVSFSIRDRFPNSTAIRRILAGLVVVSGVDDRSYLPVKEVGLEDQSGNDESSGIVSFAHFSVKEYLERTSVCPLIFRLEPTCGERFILKSSLAYILSYDEAGCVIGTVIFRHSPSPPIHLQILAIPRQENSTSR